MSRSRARVDPPIGLRSGVGVALLLGLTACEGAVEVVDTPLPVASVAMSPDQLALPVGQSVQVTATPRSASGQALTARSVVWSSDDPGVATVSGEGVSATVMAVGAGQAAIRASSEGTQGQLSLTVQNPEPVLMSLTPERTPAGTPIVLIEVRGENFVPRSMVLWGQQELSTVYLSPTALSAVVGESLLTAPGTGEVRVFNPEPGGGLSNPGIFTIEPENLRLRVRFSGTGEGTVELSSSEAPCSGSGVVCDYFFPEGTQVTLTATPSAGSGFERWTGDCSGSSSTCMVEMNADREVITEFFVGGWQSISAGESHTCGIREDARAYCWGDNTSGALGVGFFGGNAVEPLPVQGNHFFESISAGWGFTCAVTLAGEGYCWGANDFGQLGSSDVVGRNLPTPVVGGHEFRSISAGLAHACGVTTSFRGACWGKAEQIGVILVGVGGSDLSRRTTPALLEDTLRFQSISAGDFHSCGASGAVLGLVHCWGEGLVGQLGDGLFQSSRLPVEVERSGLSEPATSGLAHSCALSLFGAHVYCWGQNANGQAGAEPGTAQVGSPVLVEGTQGVIRLSAGGLHSCLVASDAAAHCWGWDAHGQLGAGEPLEGTHVPTAVAGGRLWRFIDAGVAHTCGVTLSGRALCWGDNQAGQLGTGSAQSSNRPVEVRDPNP